MWKSVGKEGLCQRSRDISEVSCSWREVSNAKHVLERKKYKIRRYGRILLPANECTFLHSVVDLMFHLNVATLSNSFLRFNYTCNFYFHAELPTSEYVQLPISNRRIPKHPKQLQLSPPEVPGHSNLDSLPEALLGT